MMKQFTDEERVALLDIKGIGPGVVARLESLGITSLRELATYDAASICGLAASDTGSTCWRNSPMALRAIASAVEFAQSTFQD